MVIGSSVFLTAYDGFGIDAANAGDFQDLRHHLICLDRDSGRLKWHRIIPGTSLLQKMNPELGRHGFASSTVATDGETVFAYFGVTGLFAFDVQGQLLWQRNLGLETHYFGSSASPIVYKDLVIVNASIENRTVYAFDKKTGAGVWQINKVLECWSMPVVGKSNAGNDELIISSKDRIAAYDPLTGQSLWHCQGIADYVVSVPIVVDGVCYFSGGKEKQMMAVRLGGQGDVQETHKLWEIKRIGSNVSSPVYRDGKLYIVHDNGIMQIVNAENGELIHRARSATTSRPFASPLLAGDFLYMPFQDVGVAVLRADETAEQVALNDFEDGQSLMASVTPCGANLLIRNDKYLYCVGSGKQTEQIAWDESQGQKIETVEAYNLNPEKQWTRRYLGFVTGGYAQTINFLLIPYNSVITDEQTEQSHEIIRGEKPKYDALRQRFVELQNQHFRAPANDGPSFDQQYAELEKDVKQLNSQTRVLVKNLFPKEQLEQHLADAKARIAHIKPEDQKQNENQQQDDDNKQDD